MSSLFPAPPCAITGIETLSFNIWLNSVSKPCPVPSLSTDVITTSPEPRSATCCAHSKTSIPVYSLPLSVYARYLPSDSLIASFATTIVEEPNIREASLIN
jgi:hypothetical protein